MFKRLKNKLMTRWIKKLALAHGFLDPVNLIQQLSRFSQPSEVIVPTELLRSGALLQARGLINSQAIQHNLDWVWPYWVEEQFNPNSSSFIPRAFSLTHINLTHRNWTAVGLPDTNDYPIVDPRGLITPFWDGWSLDFWIIDQTGNKLLPSKLKKIDQKLHYDGNIFITNEAQESGNALFTKIFVTKIENQNICRIELKGKATEGGMLVASLRPYNPEGVSFIHHIQKLKEKNGWCVNGQHEIPFDEKPDKNILSRYAKGDVFRSLLMEGSNPEINCRVGMATAAAIYNIKPGEEKNISIQIPLSKQKNILSGPKKEAGDQLSSWEKALQGYCQLNIPDLHYKNLYDTAIRTLLLHSAKEVYAGPYTYKRFWFRDAIYITYALLCAGLPERAKKIIDDFPHRQKPTGYFASQEGEWDSNGQVLWLLEQYKKMTNNNFDPKWKHIISNAANWIIRKRLKDKKDTPHAGLLPPGFSAEHFGPNDYYYWDDFWCLSGLYAASNLMKSFSDEKNEKKFLNEADHFQKCIEQSLSKTEQRLGRTGIPVSPYRRMDSGAIGSIVAGYPLKLLQPNDQKLLATVDYLINNCLVLNGFFHDMSHSGINPYLTLHIAQVLLRAGDTRFFGLIQSIAELASPTGQWPEAINPITKGGCMGDGQHVWAASEWILMIRNSFVWEDHKNMFLVLCSGIPKDWLEQTDEISFGPAPTIFGKVNVRIFNQKNKVFVTCVGDWFDKEPFMEIRMPGFEKAIVPSGVTKIELNPI